MKQLAFAWVFLSAATCSLPVLSAVNFPLGTYVYAGSAMNYKHELLSSSDGVTIQAVATNGIVLASCVVRDADASGVNFRLEVPLATVACDKAAAIGDAPACMVVTAMGSTNAATAFLPPIVAANAVTNCNIVWSNAKDYAYGEGKTVPVPDDYIDGIGYLMRQSGHSQYDAAADWDGDGVDNYSEYVAGTNPFDASDYLKISSFTSSGDQRLLTFEYVGGHLYVLKSAERLSSPGWMDTKFRTSPAAAEQTAATFEEPDDDVGVATLYVTPAADAASMFYKLEVK